MNGLEITNAAEAYTGSAIKEDVALVAINEALSRLGDMGFIYGQVTLANVEANKWYRMPSDLTNIISVIDENGDVYDDWWDRFDMIRFKDAGDKVIQARKLPDRMISLDETPDCPAAYHNVIVTYLRHFILNSADEQYAGRMRFDKFEQDATHIFNQLRRKRQPRQMKVIRHA